MLFTAPRLKVIGTGSDLPDEVIPNSHFEGKTFWNYDRDGNRIGEPVILTNEKILKITGGITQRRKARKDQTPSEMGYIAAKRAIEMAGISPNDLTGIVFGSVTEQRNFPSGAAKIQYNLGARNANVVYDVNNACAAFPEIVMQVESRATRLPGYYLVVTGEKLTDLIQEDDINSDLFGDGAGAIVLAHAREYEGVIAGHVQSDPFDGKLDYIGRDLANRLRMPGGSLVLKHASRAMACAVKEIQRELGWENVDLAILHQANGNIIRVCAENLKGEVVRSLSEMKRGRLNVYQNLERYGNMSAVTCPVALDECYRGGFIKKGDKVVIASVGSGISTAAIGIQF